MKTSWHYLVPLVVIYSSVMCVVLVARPPYTAPIVGLLVLAFGWVVSEAAAKHAESKHAYLQDEVNALSKLLTGRDNHRVSNPPGRYLETSFPRRPS